MSQLKSGVERRRRRAGTSGDAASIRLSYRSGRFLALLRPQPRGAADATCGPVTSENQLSLRFKRFRGFMGFSRSDVLPVSGEDEFAPQWRHVRIQTRDVRYTAAEDDDVWIQHVDDARQCAGEATLVPAHRLFRGRIAAV